MMQQTRDIIKRHRRTHETFEYYDLIIEKVEKNVSKNPDISIESSKALIEGICKSILLRLDSSLSEKVVNNMKFKPIYSNTCNLISQHVEFEIDFIYRTSAMIDRLAELRNERGDISHGKAAPKKYVSDIETAKMVMRVTDSILTYILTAYFSIDLSYKEEIVYEDNSEFNDFLDESYCLEEVVYSRALYDQDYDAYEEQLRDYLDNVENIEQE
jgi:hypothetical protein